MISISCVVAKDLKNGIGRNGILPWKLTNEMKHFSDLTKNTKNPDLVNCVIMGRNTWESIPQKFKPLKDRMNVILSKTMSGIPGCHVFPSFDKALEFLENNDKTLESVFAIGGYTVYKEAMQNKLCKTLYVTQIFHDFDCDIYFPEIDPSKFSLRLNCSC